jgi:hypothetical protein
MVDQADKQSAMGEEGAMDYDEERVSTAPKSY